jgi:hypothetical protein
VIDRQPYTFTDRKGRKVTITPTGESFTMRNFPMEVWFPELLDDKAPEKPQDAVCEQDEHVHNGAGAKGACRPGRNAPKAAISRRTDAVHCPASVQSRDK